MVLRNNQTAQFAVVGEALLVSVAGTQPPSQACAHFSLSWFARAMETFRNLAPRSPLASHHLVPAPVARSFCHAGRSYSKPLLSRLFVWMDLLICVLFLARYAHSSLAVPWAGREGVPMLNVPCGPIPLRILSSLFRPIQVWVGLLWRSQQSAAEAQRAEATRIKDYTIQAS